MVDKISNEKNIKSWLYRVSMNYCVDVLRKKKTKKGLVNNWVLPEPIFFDLHDSMILDPNDEFEAKEKKERLNFLLDTLDPSDKNILIMKYVDCLKASEISEIIGKTLSATKAQVRNARLKVVSKYMDLY